MDEAPIAPSSHRPFSSKLKTTGFSIQDMEVDFRTLLKEVAVIALLGALALGLYAFITREQSQLPETTATTTAAVASTPAPVTLHDDASAWNAELTHLDARTKITDDPAFQKRFPKGLTVTIIDDTRAPEALRGEYDDDPFALRFGAVWPEPQPGQTIRPDKEAWADCVRDFELGPTDALRCYLFARGEPGETLDRLASSALHQALRYALTGRVTSDPSWTPDDAFLSLSPSSP